MSTTEGTETDEIPGRKTHDPSVRALLGHSAESHMTQGLEGSRSRADERTVMDDSYSEHLR